jgi:hypothetical protein
MVVVYGLLVNRLNIGILEGAYYKEENGGEKFGCDLMNSSKSTRRM